MKAIAKPLIGILGNLLITEGGMFPGIERAYVNDKYVEAVEMAGGVPIVVPVLKDPDTIERQVAGMDGILIPGGYDVSPEYYNEEPLQKLGFIYPRVDQYYLKVIEFCTTYGKPMLGICKGMQILNVAFGGTLYQDLSYMDGCSIKHMQSSKRSAPGHSVEMVQGSRLYEILGSRVMTNSFHHQCIKDMAPGFKVTAKAKDGVIEAIEKDDDVFVIGVQWHPEDMAQDSVPMKNLFSSLVQASKRHADQS